MQAQSFVDKLAWILIVDRRVLAARSKGKEAWYLPGGKREPGESDEQALRREIREELTVELDPATIHWLGEFSAQAHGKPEGTPVRMRCYTAGYQGDLTPAAEIAELGWLTLADREKASPVVQIILDWLHAQGWIAD